jgi:hypothetical protein
VTPYARKLDLEQAEHAEQGCKHGYWLEAWATVQLVCRSHPGNATISASSRSRRLPYEPASTVFTLPGVELIFDLESYDQTQVYPILAGSISTAEETTP